MMATSVANWLLGTSYSMENNKPSIIIEENPDIQIDEAAPTGDNEDVDDDDTPPMFPAPSSAQRTSTNTLTPYNRLQSPSASFDSRLMPPPLLPASALSVPDASSRVSLSPSITVSSPSSTLRLPPTTVKPPNPKRREKVALAPGYGPLNWAALKSSGKDLRGVDTLGRITPSMLKQHNTREDAWSAINGKVYNISPYLPFHPGGEKELMRVAGRDGSKLFALTHAWVNAEFMLDECLVGFLVPETS